jgi:hypothetical protein
LYFFTAVAFSVLAFLDTIDRVETGTADFALILTLFYVLEMRHTQNRIRLLQLAGQIHSSALLPGAR